MLYTKKTSVVLGSGAKSNSIPYVTYLQCPTNLEQTLSMVHNRSSLLMLAISRLQGNILGKCFISGDETTTGAEIDWKTSNVVALRWLNAAGTSHNILSLIWCHSTALATSPSYIILRCLLRRSPPPSRNTFK